MTRDLTRDFGPEQVLSARLVALQIVAADASPRSVADARAYIEVADALADWLLTGCTPGAAEDGRVPAIEGAHGVTAPPLPDGERLATDQAGDDDAERLEAASLVQLQVCLVKAFARRPELRCLENARAFASVLNSSLSFVHEYIAPPALAEHGRQQADGAA